jgi:hypothetical protein
MFVKFCARSTTPTIRASTTSTHTSGLEKQSPTVTYGPVNDAMYAAELKLLRDWRDIVHAWEHMQ